jgi:hypothetical protein
MGASLEPLLCVERSAIPIGGDATIGNDTICLTNTWFPGGADANRPGDVVGTAKV